MVARAVTKATRERRNTNPAPVPKATAKSAPVIELPRLLTAEELAEIFHCSTRTIRRMWNAGELPSVTMRGQRYTRVGDLHKLLDSLR